MARRKNNDDELLETMSIIQDLQSGDEDTVDRAAHEARRLIAEDEANG